MKLTSVNIGQSRLNTKGRRTGIFKEPVAGAVRVGKLGLAGDAVVDTRHHGGPDQAVYVYSVSDYAWWATQLNRAMPPGTFGENLTLDSYASAEAGIGDRITIGEVVLEVTSPRVPCGTLENRMDLRGFINAFIDAERPGVYCRVISEGNLSAGQAVTVEPYTRGERVLSVDVFREFYASPHHEAVLRRHLAAPIAERTRRDDERELAKLLPTL